MKVSKTKILLKQKYENENKNITKYNFESNI